MPASRSCSWACACAGTFNPSAVTAINVASRFIMTTSERLDRRLSTEGLLLRRRARGELDRLRGSTVYGTGDAPDANVTTKHLIKGASTPRRTVTASPTSMPPACRTDVFTGTMYLP